MNVSQGKRRLRREPGRIPCRLREGSFLLSRAARIQDRSPRTEVDSTSVSNKKESVVALL
jgi:hypothetical protein